MPAKKRPAGSDLVVTEKKPGLGGTTFGGFQDPSYISIGDGYNQKIPVPSRHLGAPSNMPKWNPPCPMKVGRTQDVFFTKKTARLGEEMYADPGRSKKEGEERTAAKKAVLGPPWKNPNPSKQSTGPGSVYGSFQEAKDRQFKHDYDYAVPKKDEIPEQPTLQPKNIIVQAGKRGGFGVQAQGVYFSAPEAIQGDKRDKYDAQKQKEIKENEEHKKRVLAPDRPFKSSSKSKSTFDETAGVGISKIYTYPSDKKLPAIKEKDGATKVPAALAARGPFRYSSPSKSGETGCLAPFAPYGRMDGKVDKYDQKQIDERDARKKAPKSVGAGPWMPSAGTKSGCTKTLLPKFH